MGTAIDIICIGSKKLAAPLKCESDCEKMAMPEGKCGRFFYVPVNSSEK